MRDLKRHGHIIALSQSELMLVIALIFLLLFFMEGIASQHGEKGDDDAVPVEQCENDCPEDILLPEKEFLRELIILLESAGLIDNHDASDLSDQQQVAQAVHKMIDFQKEITEALESSGLIDDQDIAQNDRSESVISAVQQSIEVLTELNEYLESTGLLDKSTAKENISGDSTLLVAGKAIENLKKLNELNAEINQLLSEFGIESDGDNLESLRDLARNFRILKQQQGGKPSDSVHEIAKKLEDNLLDEIGFIPCWLGDGSPRYYFTFEMTYFPETNKFSIEPHPHWNVNDTTVSRDVRSRLPAMHEYPRGQVNWETLEAYAKKLNLQKESIHGIRCQLATRLNEEANGVIVKRIHNLMRLYPVFL